MDSNFWLNKWQSNDIAFNQMKPNSFMQRYFSTLRLKPGSQILVPLCGKSIDMVWLSDMGFQVLGIELSETACESFFKEHDIPVTKTNEHGYTKFTSENITLLAGDIFSFDQSIIGNVDAVYDRAALIALTVDLRKQYVEHISSLIEPDTPVFLITMSYVQDQMMGPPFSVDREEVNQLFMPSFSIELIESKIIHDVPEHLSNKGLKKTSEDIYKLVKHA